MSGRYRRIIGSRLIVTALAVAVQALWFLGLLRFLSAYAFQLNITLTVLAVPFVLYVVNKRDEPAYKLLWITAILVFPLFGMIIYLCFGDRKTSLPLKKRLARSRARLGPRPEGQPDVVNALEREAPRVAQTYRYVEKLGGYSVCPVEAAEYYPLGEEMFAAMLEELRGARRYIYIESFIITEGVMWAGILDILKEKAAQGLDIRVIYDDMGSLTTLPPGYAERLRSWGIHCIAFNPMRLLLSGTLNNRDHRKIMVIDGRVAFSGGINLADEYINAVEKYGHWKDVGFRVTGPAALHYADMFLEFWNAFSPDPAPLPKCPQTHKAGPHAGCVLPYYDAPIYRDAVSNQLYIDLLGQAQRYAWFYTPYLMLGETLLDAFIRAAGRGVDVRIYMPGIPDKKIIFRLSRSFYRPLLEAGVRIYEYTPGFLHAKACLVDDELGTIGSVNLDFRSLFLHFECNALFYRAPLLRELKDDFGKTQELCREVSPEDQPTGICRRIADSVLRMIAPLC